MKRELISAMCSRGSRPFALSGARLDQVDNLVSETARREFHRPESLMISASTLQPRSTFGRFLTFCGDSTVRPVGLRLQAPQPLTDTVLCRGQEDRRGRHSRVPSKRQSRLHHHQRRHVARRLAHPTLSQSSDLHLHRRSVSPTFACSRRPHGARCQPSPIAACLTEDSPLGDGQSQPLRHCSRFTGKTANGRTSSCSFSSMHS